MAARGLIQPKVTEYERLTQLTSAAVYGYRLWTFVLSGLAYVGLWAFTRIPAAIWGGTGAVVAAAILALGHCFWLAARTWAEA